MGAGVDRRLLAQPLDERRAVLVEEVDKAEHTLLGGAVRERLRLGVLLPQLVRSGPRDWAQIAAGGGFFDQSHLIREFRHLAGIAPGAYTPTETDRPTHVALATPKNLSNTAGPRIA